MTQQSTEDIIARYLAEYSNVSYWYGGQVLESKFLRIAAATLKAAVILVNPSMKERFEAVDEWVSVVFPPDTDYEIPARDMRRQVESVVDRSARYFKVLSENEEYINIPQDDVNAVLDIVINSLRQSSKKFTPSNVVQKMYAPSEAISLLGSDFDAECDRASILDSARGFGRVVLEACCYQLVSWAQQIPQVQSLAAWTTLANTWALTSATSDIIRELRQTGLAQARDPNRIIASQRRDIANVLGKMELFGLPVEPRYRRIPISVSYVTARGKAATSSQSRIVSFEKLIEDALALRPSFSPGIRLLIIGRAGSGKTTAAQWLAHQAAIGGLGAINAVFRYSIPFFVRLRFTFAKENEASLPADSALLMSGQLREGLGADWIEGLGRDHPPLIVFDGWDELKTNQRNLAGAWLSSLCRRFPYAHIVATSRPEGAGDPVFADEKFTRITLTPLEPERKVLLINQWFDGLKINLEQAPDFDQMNLEDAQRLLIRDVQRPSMMEFTDTPLITSMLCCLYATSRQRNPPSKGALYKTVGTTLIHTRDEDRGVSAGIWDELSYEQKEDLLGEVALKMVEAGILDLPVESIDESFTSVEYIVSDLLPKFGKSSSVSYSLVKNILERSVVLQEVGYRRAEFVHRSFQDYFVGTMLARRWEYEKLFEHVRKDDRLLSLFPFATQAAEQRVADILITWLIDLQIKATGARRKEILFVLIERLNTEFMGSLGYFANTQEVHSAIP